MLKSYINTLILMITIFCGWVHAGQGFLLNQAYFEDASNLMTLQEVKSQTFTLYDGWLTKGYRSSTFWIRLDIGPYDQDLILRIRPAHVENIPLFDSSGSDSLRMTGAKYRSADADVQSFSHNFNLWAEIFERQIFLKIKTNRTYVLNFEVLPLSEFLNVE